jgi:insulysin
MGSEKYPKENDYNEFLAANSGTSNAFTAMDSTNYFFDVHPSALSGALSRFSQFFASPLFLEACCERELQAIESEHSKNLQSDDWRAFQLDKSTSERDDGKNGKGQVYWKFGTGNLKTLRDEPIKEGIITRDRLLDWWEGQYSANLMKLCVLGNRECFFERTEKEKLMNLRQKLWMNFKIWWLEIFRMLRIRTILLRTLMLYLIKSNNSG